MNWPIQPKCDLPSSGYLTKAQVLARYQISNSTLYAWAAAADSVFPKPVRIGPRAVRFLASDLAAYEAQILAEHGARVGKAR